MKRLILAALILPAAVVAQAPSRDSIITVNMTRTSHTAPDRVTAYVIVEGTAETPADANARLGTKTTAAAEALKALGRFVELDKPIAYGVSLVQNNNGYPANNVPTSYISRAVMRVQLSRLDQLSTVVATAIAAGASTVSGMSFESSLADSVRRERIAEAINTAKIDAQATATALGGKLGALVDVTTGGSNINFGQSSQLYFDARYVGGSTPAPDISMTTSVTLRYHLIR